MSLTRLLPWFESFLLIRVAGDSSDYEHDRRWDSFQSQVVVISQCWSIHLGVDLVVVSLSSHTHLLLALTPSVTASSQPSSNLIGRSIRSCSLIGRAAGGGVVALLEVPERGGDTRHIHSNKKIFTAKNVQSNKTIFTAKIFKAKNIQRKKTN